MKKIVTVLTALALGVTGLAPAGAGPSEGGISSDNVEFVQFIPFEVGTATGARVIGKYLYVTSWRSFSIYDISDPENPARVSTTPFGFKFENEDVGTNGKIMLFSEETPRSILHIWDVEDKSNPVEIATLSGAGQHTTTCILKCKWGYGSDGAITDLRDPTNPKLMTETWGEGMPAGNNGHDVTEVANGLVLTSTNPLMLLDARKDPLHPKLLAVSETMDAFVHSNQWPRQAKDRFALSTGETWVPGLNARCNENSAGLTSWDTTGWKKTHTLRRVDTINMQNGTYIDGSPAGANAPFGCSSHWFEQHPTFHDGGLVAAGFYNHGTRFIDVAKDGSLTEVGWFLPHAGGTSAAYWVTDELVYAVDYQRGLDVLRFTGD